MLRDIRTMGLVALLVALTCSLSFAWTFSVDGGPAGSVPSLYTDGTLIGFSGPLDGSPDVISNLLSGYPVDALHIGAPVAGVVTRADNNVGLRVIGPIFFSIDHGDPFPIQGVGIGIDSAEEILVAPKMAVGAPDGTHGTAISSELGSLGSAPALEPNIGLGGDGVAFDDDVDALDLSNFDPQNPGLIFFSIDDLVPLVPNSPGAMQTNDIFVRLTSGSVVKILDGVADLGLFRGNMKPFILNDDVDALLIVNLDDDPRNNISREVMDPKTQQMVWVDLGDGILFSVDRDLPDPDGSGPNAPYLPSLDPTDIYYSSLDGSRPVLVIDGEEAFLASSAPLALAENDDLDALGAHSTVIPEPATMLLVGTGVLTLIGIGRRRALK